MQGGNNTGVEPLKQMVAAGEKVEATGYMFVSLGAVPDAAREYAKQNDIELIQAERFVAFFGGNAQIDLS
ncbi:MAG: restriction endonuclease [Granulosicoccus sp.]